MSEFVSGSEIISNPGNAALGYSSGASYNGNPEMTNPFGGIQSTLSQVVAEENRRRQFERERQLKEQDDLAQFLAHTGNTAFNLPTSGGEGGTKAGAFSPLQEDEPLQMQQADDLRRFIASRPRDWKFNPEVRTKIDEFNRLNRHASVRAVEVAKRYQLANSTNDPDERAAILKSIEDIRKTPLTDFAAPEPYMPKQTFDITKFIGEDVLTGKNKEAMSDYLSTAGVDAQGNEVIQNMRGISDNALDFRGKAAPGSAIYADAVNLSRNFLGGGILRNPNAILQMNQNIDAINKARGYGEGSQHRIPYVATVLPNGAVQLNQNLKPQDIAYAVLAEHYGGLQPSQEVKRTASQVKHEKAEEDIQKSNANLGWANLKQRIKEYEQNKGKLTKEEEKENRDLKAVMSVVDDVEKVFTPKGKPKIGSVAPATKLLFESNGISTEQFDIYPITRGEADKYIGIQAPEVSETIEGDKGQKTITKSKGGSAKPSLSFLAVDKKTGKKQLMFVSQDQGVVSVPEKEAIVNGLKHDANYIPGQYEGKIALVEDAMSEKQEGPTEGDRKMEGGKRMQFNQGRWRVVKGIDQNGNLVFE